MFLLWLGRRFAGFFAQPRRAQQAQDRSGYPITTVSDEAINAWSDPARWRQIHYTSQPAPTREHAQDGNPAEKSRMPAAIRRLDVHPLVKLSERKGRFSRHSRVMIIAK